MLELKAVSIRNRIPYAKGLVAIASLFASVASVAITGVGCSDTGTLEITCTDGLRNGSETDIDCGGGSCAPCAPGQSCTDGSSCTTGVCVNEMCQVPTCIDGVQNGDETSIDCGGSCILPETCNGRDDDCNGTIDDGIASITCGVGACQKTVPGCTAGQTTKCEPVAAGTEICDGLLDENCDGSVDEGCSCENDSVQDCYSGSPTTMGVGACQTGRQTCVDGMWGACSGEVMPTGEVCNGIDDDCNGQVDDGLAPVSCGVGACAVTVPACENGVPATCSPGQPITELCNGVDDDCNGQVDDGVAPVSCGVGACAVTVPACENGVPATCSPGQPITELCNGVDDDCNGTVDNGNPGGGVSCNAGQPGICSDGLTACVGGVLECHSIMQAGVETCDGILDENCNGVVDEGCSCTTGQMRTCYEGPAGTVNVGRCAPGSQTCTNGMWGSCTGQTLPTPETCNGLDDDCNGSTDENNPGGGSSCNTGNPGICMAGTMTCVSGMLTCVQNTSPAPMEDCGTTVDDDCDGQTNEGCLCVPFSTRSCYSGPAGTAGVGICRAGTQTCDSNGTSWGPCTGQVTPMTESCKNNLDDDCDGQVNEGCSALNCQDFYVEDFNDGSATAQTSGGGVYQVNWCNSYVATPSNTPTCMLPGQTTRTNASGGTNTFVGIWVHKATASCSAVRLSYEWYQFANAGAVVEYKQTTDTFASYSSCSASSGWTTAVPSSSMSTLQTCSSIMNINIPFGSSPAVYIKFKSTNAQNNAMWWDDIKLTLVGCDC